jgi:hypothetical protein
VHPQKRAFIKQILESSIARICEIKKDLVLFNPRPGSIYVHLDHLLFDLKYAPSVLEIPVPRNFKEDDRIPVQIEFKEKVAEEDGGKKKKKKKKKVEDDDDDKKKPPPMTLEEKTHLVVRIIVLITRTNC